MSGQTIPVVAIIGRPNVGKSALFNRLIRKRRSLVDATPGLTRDRLYGDTDWRGVHFKVVDTGGLQFARGDRLGEAIAAQVAKALEEASLALLVCDAKEGPLPLDAQVASWVRRWGKPTLLVANKVDNSKDTLSVPEFSTLGLGEPQAISSLHGLGIGELLDQIVEKLKKAVKAGTVHPSPPEADPPPVGTSSGRTVLSVRGELVEPRTAAHTLRVAVVGRPNVGKSSFINRVLNEERVVVGEAPGTTRDPVETEVVIQGRTFCLIDTAGIHARRRLKSRIDAVVRLKAVDAIHESDVCLGILEASTGIVQDDLKLFDRVLSAGKPLCLAVNKWDLLKEPPDPERAAAAIARRAPFLRFAPVICMSAKTGLNVFQTLERVAEVAARSNRRIGPEEESRLLEVIGTDPRAPVAIRNLRVLRLTQSRVSPPTFHLVVRPKKSFRGSLTFKGPDLAYLEGLFRRELRMEGTPVRIHLLRGGAR